MKKILVCGIFAVFTLTSADTLMEKRARQMLYPPTRTDGTVDDYFGTMVPDPYRWLEDDNSDETKQWVMAQNLCTRYYLDMIPYRERIRERLTELWNYPKYGIPERVGDYYFYFENDGLQNQSILYRQDGLHGERKEFLNPNTMSETGTVALVDVSFSSDDRYMAYAAAEAGSDWVEIRVVETATGRQLDDHIHWVKFSGAVWCGDGFYYSGYDRPDESSQLTAQNRGQKVFYHRLGTDQSADELVFENPDEPLRYYRASVSRDERYLFISAMQGTDGTEILYRNLKESSEGFRVLFEGFDHNHEFVYADQDRAYFLTNQYAPNYRLWSVDLRKLEQKVRDGKISVETDGRTSMLAPTHPAEISKKSPDTEPDSFTPLQQIPIPEWLNDVIPPSRDRLLSVVTIAGGTLYAQFLEKATSVVEQYDLDGERLRAVQLPGLGTAAGFKAKADDTITFFSFSTYTEPPAIYSCLVETGEVQPYRKAEVSFDPADFETKQVFFKSKGGTNVSMFLNYRKGMELTGENPVYLYGYGGFNISMTPGFSPQHILLMEQGGIYAVVNLRGGSEYGESWHKAGMLDRKQNVFDDFIGAAEYLIAEGYTRPEKLGIAGGSNGGLLVGACMTQRPELYAVALPAVGVLDMLRFHKFTVGWGWVVEYGSSDNEAEFQYLYRYSPLHNVREGTCYPATLITTADHDDRVVPAHSFKFAATLQKAQSCDNPVLIRIETDAGHGAGKPTAKRIAELTDVYSFFFEKTGTNIK